jgi:putative toxin-antitoxin system antitoxin component (TIGR02293 family)
MSAMKALSKTPKKPKESPYAVKFQSGLVMEASASLPYGRLIPAVRMARNYSDLQGLIGPDGFTNAMVQPLLSFLDLPGEKLALLLGVSARTLSRWSDESHIGVLASKSLLELDKCISQGINVFGSQELFQQWFHQPNASLGDISPADAIASPFGIEMVSDALEAMAYGNVL